MSGRMCVITFHPCKVLTALTTLLPWACTCFFVNGIRRKDELRVHHNISSCKVLTSVMTLSPWTCTYFFVNGIRRKDELCVGAGTSQPFILQSPYRIDDSIALGLHLFFCK